MKTHKLKVTLNEIKRMQQLAGILKEEENPYDSFFDDDTPKSNSTSSKYKNVPSLEELEKKMKNGYLDLRNSDIEALPKGLEVTDDLRLDDCTSLKELPQGLKVGRYLSLDDCTSLEKLPKGLKVGGSLSAVKCKSLKEIPQDMKVEGSLQLGGCTSLKELPNGLHVRGNLSLIKCTSLKELPKGLNVGYDIYLQGTPIAEKYSEEQIRSMIENGGGYVKGRINTGKVNRGFTR